MKKIKRLLSLVLTVMLILTAAQIGNVSANAEKTTHWMTVSVRETGVYKIEPVNYEYDYYGLNALWDENDNLVQYYDKLGGYPLVANQEYLPVIKGCEYWQVTKIADTIFPDTKSSGWYNDAVTYAVGRGIMSGYSNGNFGTSDSIQRQDFLVMLARLDGVDLEEYNYDCLKFSDVGRNSYYEAAVNWGAENGIVTGYNSYTFGVGDKVTREQLVTFLYRYAKFKSYNTVYSSNVVSIVSNQYNDFRNVSGFAREAILWAIDKGVISGKTNTTIVPQGKAQRCEVAKIMFNIYFLNIFKEADDDILLPVSGTVKFASTIDPRDDGTQYVIDAFEDKYDINVKIVSCTMDGYIAEMTALIAAGMSPDVGRSNGDFPACVAYLDSLDKANIDYTDPIWKQNTFKLSTFNGSPYMCDTWGNYWTEFDICVYSKPLLNAAGCPTPQQLDAQGQWTWDNFMMIAEKCTQTEGAPAGYISTETALNMAGGSVFKIQNGRIVSGIDAYTTAIFKKYAESYKKGILNNQSSRGIIEGTTAIGTCHAWSLRKDGDLFGRGSNCADLGFWYLPAYTAGGARPVTGYFRGWGIMRGAQNPVGGGIFLRHYLDVNNYDTQNAFISEEAKQFFYQLTAQELDDYNPYLTYVGLNEAIAGVRYNQDIYSVMKTEPASIESKMPAVKAAADKGVKNFNDHIVRYTNY